MWPNATYAPYAPSEAHHFGRKQAEPVYRNVAYKSINVNSECFLLGLDFPVCFLLTGHCTLLPGRS